MLKIENVSKSFGAQELFKDLSFTVAPGEKLGWSAERLWKNHAVPIAPRGSGTG